MTVQKGSKSARRRATEKTDSGHTSSRSTVPSKALSVQTTLPESTKHFRFLELPAELRIRIYEEVLIANTKTIDLHPDNYRCIHPRLALFLVSKTVHEEAYRVFYAQTIRIFPTHGRFFYTKKPLLARLSSRYRTAINTAELVFGPGWTAPPKCQSINTNLGLDACVNLRMLKILVTCDPSEIYYYGFRGRDATEDTYRNFCVDLLQGLIEELPSLETVEIAANDGLKKDSPLIAGIADVVRAARLRLQWGPMLCSTGSDEVNSSLHGLSLAVAGLSLEDATGVIRSRSLECFA